MRTFTITLCSILVAACGLDSHVVDTTPTAATDSQDLSAALSASPSSVPLAPGAAAQVSLTLSGKSKTPYTLSVAGLPSGVSGAFSAATITGSATVTLTLSATTSASSASAKATVSAVSAAGTTKKVALTVTVTAAGSGGGAGGGAGGGSGGGAGGGSGSVGPTGGKVDLLRFGTVGDTRPPQCEQTTSYPTPIINAIADAAQTKQLQFMLDTGDHMYVCNNSLAEATTQMNLFTTATQRFSGQWFMTMGNHECFHGPCLPGSTNANYVAFMNALSPVANLPYYSFNVDTRLGRATFVVVADNAYDQAQAAWLENTLATADTAAAYTIIARHHPQSDSSVATNHEVMTIIRRHKFALFLTGHSHLYKHETADNGRDIVIGIGGAPLTASGSDFNGYALVEQQADGTLKVTVYNVVGDVVRDSWSVGPN